MSRKRMSEDSVVSVMEEDTQQSDVIDVSGYGTEAHEITTDNIDAIISRRKMSSPMVDEMYSSG